MTTVLIVLGIIIGLVLAVFIIGFTAKKEFKGALTNSINFSVEEVWEVLTDVKGIPNRNKYVTDVEVIGQDKERIEWKEVFDLKGYARFTMHDIDLNKSLTITMHESSFGMMGTWKYDLEEVGGKCSLTITENSAIKAIWVRASMTLAGRSANLKKEFTMLQKGLTKKG